MSSNKQDIKPEVPKKKWHELDQKERVSEIFAKYSIKDFWKWWSDNESLIMEVRIKDFELIKEISEKYYLPKSPSGVYVRNDLQLKTVIGLARNKATMWFGINPKKKNYNRKGWKTFGGKDIHINTIKFLFFDIDREGDKDRPAMKAELLACDNMAEMLIERMGREGWNKNYCKIASGNGVQLLFKLDTPIMMPEIYYDKVTGLYEMGENFLLYREMIKKGIGKNAYDLSKQFKKEMGVIVDKSCLNIGRVAALPQTKNYKYGGFTWRGVIEIVNEGINIGLTDYIMAIYDDEEKFKTKSPFIAARRAKPKDVLTEDNINNHPLVRLLTEQKLPTDGRNNKLWFTLKIMVRDSSSIDFDSKTFKKIHTTIEQVQQDTFPTNVPGAEYKFGEDVANAYCIKNLIPPVFPPLWSHRTIRINKELETFIWEDLDIFDKTKLELSGNDMKEDMEEFFEKYLGEQQDKGKVDKYASFLYYCLEKYGQEKTKYYFDYVFPRRFCYVVKIYI